MSWFWCVPHPIRELANALTERVLGRHDALERKLMAAFDDLKAEIVAAVAAMNAAVDKINANPSEAAIAEQTVALKVAADALAAVVA